MRLAVFGNNRVENNYGSSRAKNYFIFVVWYIVDCSPPRTVVNNYRRFSTTKK